jgi:release factor glutamine methyltransferase
VKLKEALAHARAFLSASDIEDSTFEAEILLRHVLKITRPLLYQKLDEELNRVDEDSYSQLIKRRQQGEPTAYITGYREFYGLDFYVDRNVLIPRPESELLVEKALEIVRGRDMTNIVDVGTGCGAIAISLAKNLTGIKIYATDISLPALKVAESNCRRHDVNDRIELLQGDMLEPLPGLVNLIIANLPYVRKSDVPDSGPLSFEPVLALDGGRDGLSLIERLCRQAKEKITNGGYMILEIGEGQAGTVNDIIHELFPAARVEITGDYAGIDRVVGTYLT